MRYFIYAFYFSIHLLVVYLAENWVQMSVLSVAKELMLMTILKKKPAAYLVTMCILFLCFLTNAFYLWLVVVPNCDWEMK